MNWGAVFFVLMGVALATLWLARRSRAATGLPVGRLVYADTTSWQGVKRPLFSRTHLLTGRPDYLVQHGREVIPVEVKSGRAPLDGPYDSHILQLAAYCLLVEETYGHRPPYGLVLYTADGGQAYEINYTPALESKLLDSLAAMRRALAHSETPRDHNQIARCQACGYRSNCDQSLT